MSTQLAQLQEATIKQHCKMLRMPMMGLQFSSLAEQAVKEKGLLRSEGKDYVVKDGDILFFKFNV